MSKRNKFKKHKPRFFNPTKRKDTRKIPDTFNAKSVMDWTKSSLPWNNIPNVNNNDISSNLVDTADNTGTGTMDYYTMSTPTCQDISFSGGDWYDCFNPFGSGCADDGDFSDCPPVHGCDWYAIHHDDGNDEGYNDGLNRCERWGHTCERFGYTANEACCICGGGEQIGDQGQPPPVQSTDYDAEDAQSDELSIAIWNIMECENCCGVVCGQSVCTMALAMLAWRNNC